MPFTPADAGGLAPGQAVECPSEGTAIRRAEAMSRQDANAGAVAFSRRGDPNIGGFEGASRHTARCRTSSAMGDASGAL